MEELLEHDFPINNDMVLLRIHVISFPFREKRVFFFFFLFYLILRQVGRVYDDASIEFEMANLNSK